MTLSINLEASGLTLPFTKELQLTPLAGEHCHIVDCILTESHREGISNVINHTTIERCKSMNNGYGKYEGVRQFPDNTRYAINCEDCLPLNLIVRDCYFYEHFNGILFAGGNITVDNNIFNNMASCLVVYNCEIANFTNNKTISCGTGVKNATANSKFSRSINVSHNHFIHTEPLGIGTDNIITTFTNNTVEGSYVGYNDGTKNVVWSNNIIKAYRKRNGYLNQNIGGDQVKDSHFIIADVKTSTARTTIRFDESSSNNRVSKLNTINGVGLNTNLYNCALENLGEVKVVEKNDNGKVVAELNCRNTTFNNTYMTILLYYSSMRNVKQNFYNCKFEITEDIATLFKYITNFSQNYWLFDSSFVNCEFIFKSKVNYIFNANVTCPYTGTIKFKDCKFSNLIQNNTIKLHNFNQVNTAPDGVDLPIMMIDNCTFDGLFDIPVAESKIKTIFST